MIKSKKNILFVAYYFPPTKTIACVRAFNICYELTKRFNVHVFTTSNQDKFLHDNYPFLPIKALTKLRTFDFRTILPNSQIRNKTAGKKWGKYMFKLLWNFPLNIIFGIGGLIYILHGYYKGKRWVKKYNISHLYSSFIPYSDHCICYLLKKRFPDLIWIADFRDLHIDEVSNDMMWLRYQKRMNQRILNLADIVTTVSKGLHDVLKQYHSNVIVVRNAIGELNHNILDRLPNLKNHFFQITYTGNLIGDHRKPDRLLQALRELLTEGGYDRIKVKYAGNYHEVWKDLVVQYELCNNSETQGLIPLESSYSLQKNSQINLLLTSSSPQLKGVLTGKFFEYLAAGNPILLIIHGDHDEELEEIFKSLNCGMIVYHGRSESVGKIKCFIRDLYEEWRKDENISSKYNESVYKEYEMSYQINKLLEHI